MTDDYGNIVSANAAIGRLLLISQRGLSGRSILGFFAPDRERASAQMRRAARGYVAQFTATVRPRDRKAFDVRVDICTAPFERGGSLEWTLEPIRT